MRSRWLVLARLTRAIWFRAALFTAGAVLLALVAGVAGPLLPREWELNLGQDAVTTILQIVASSMLAVTTFSVSAMVSAFFAAASATTPRATQLLIADRTTQNALSSFLGSFVFAVVGIIALSTGYYDERGRAILFLGALAVVALVVITLLQWISHLSEFGRMADVIDRVERRTAQIIGGVREQPRFGAAPPATPQGCLTPLCADSTGYVTHLDAARLQALATEHDLRVHVLALPGTLVDEEAELAQIEGEPSDDALAGLAAAFEIEHHRTFDQDPRLGVVALSEIGCRALSPAVNDPGTAIEVLAALLRVMRPLVDPVEAVEPRHDRVHVPALELRDLVEDAFVPLARDGAATVEVATALQRTLSMLMRPAGPAQSEVLRAMSLDAQQRAVEALSSPRDREQVLAAAPAQA